MANASKTSSGSIVGIVLGIVLVGGLAATPFYISKLETPERAINDAAKNDIEAVRRVVLDLDQNLIALADMDAALAEDEKLTAQTAEQIKSAHPDVLGDELARRLNQTAQLVKEAEKADEVRKTGATAGASRPANVQDAGAARRSYLDYLAANEKLRTQATTTIDQLRRLTVGDVTAGGVLASNRIQALYLYLAGKINYNRADFEQEQASVWRRAAIQRLQSVASLQREIAALKAQTPATAIANVRDLIKQVDEQIVGAEGELSKLRPRVDSLAAELAKAESKAAEARQAMDALCAANGQVRRVEDAERYGELASKARKAEAKAAELLNGMLVDAEVIPMQTDDTFTVKYKGGKPREGLRDLRFRLEQQEADLAAWQASRSDLEKQEAALKAQSKDIEAQASKATATAESYSAEVGKLLAKAEERGKAAGKARAEAIKAFVQADGYAQNAIRDAKTRTKNATEKARASGGGTPNECFELISKDSDAEAGLRCLTAEIAFNVAVTDAGEIEELKDQAATQALVAKLAGGEAPADVSTKIQTLRTEAANKLADATKAYEAAEKLASSVSAKTSTGSVSGGNYVWQIQIGEAAVQLLRASLAALVDGTPDRQAQENAYELLTKIAQGREQSPLISTAIDTLQYLQQTAQ